MRNYVEKTSYGSEDAAVTGKYGLAYYGRLKRCYLLIYKKVIFKTKPLIHVNPIFGHTQLKVDFQCIFSIRLGNVITAMKSVYRALNDKEVMNCV